MITQHDIEQNTDEWKLFRAKYFTSSSFSDLFMGPSTAGYNEAILKVAFGRIGKVFETFKGNKYTEQGHEEEDSAKGVYELITLDEVVEGKFWTRGEWLGSSPDGLINSDGMFEHKAKVAPNTIYKSLSDWKMGIRLTEKSNKKHWWQVNHQMYVCDREWVDYMITPIGYKPMIERIYRSKEVDARIEAKLELVIPEVEQKAKFLKSQLNEYC